MPRIGPASDSGSFGVSVEGSGAALPPALEDGVVGCVAGPLPPPRLERGALAGEVPCEWPVGTCGAAGGVSGAGAGVVVVVVGGDSELAVGGVVSVGTTGTVWVSVVVAGACAARL